MAYIIAENYSKYEIKCICVPMMKPRDAPLNLPSVIKHVEFPSPAPIKAPVGPFKFPSVICILLKRYIFTHLTSEIQKYIYNEQSLFVDEERNTYLWHPRCTFWSLIPKYDDSTWFNLASGEGRIESVQPNKALMYYSTANISNYSRIKAFRHSLS